MTIEATLRSRISDAFPGALVILENESHKHNVPEGSETHFGVTVVAAEFDAMSRVKRHQAVYGAAADLLDGPVHALALHLYTPAQWDERHHQSPTSPECLGGGR
jgi:BolA protein